MNDTNIKASCFTGSFQKKMEAKKAKNGKDDERPSAQDEYQEGIGQGELYSPEHAIRVPSGSTSEEEGGGRGIGGLVGDDTRRNLSLFKEKLLEKLSAASVPKDALENARQGIERVIRDISVAARGLTMDALHRIRSNLADLLPGIQKSKLNMMVDDAEKEATAARTAKGDAGREEKPQQPQEQGGKTPYMAPASSAVRLPQSRL